MECSSMISIAAFGSGDLGSIPCWFLSRFQIKHWKINTKMIQAYDLAMPIVNTVTVSALYGVININ